MEEITKKHILQLSGMLEEYRKYNDKVGKNPMTSGLKQRDAIHITNLVKRINKKQSDILHCIHSKVLFLTLQKGGVKKKMIVTNITKEDFNLMNINNIYQGYEIIGIEEIDTNTYEEPL